MSIAANIRTGPGQNRSSFARSWLAVAARARDGLWYPPDPPTVQEIIAVMRAAGDDPDGVRLRGVIIVLWRAGLRIAEGARLNATDLDRDRRSAQLPTTRAAAN